MKQRYNRIGKEVEEDSTRTNPEEFRSTLRDNWGDGYARRRVGGGMSRRVIIYLLALLALAYYILF